MKSNLGRVVLGIAVVAVAVVLLIVLKDDGDDRASGGGATTTEQAGSKPTARPKEPSIPVIVVKDGKPVGGVEELSFDAGEQIRFKVRSNLSDEVHIHGYDVEKAVRAGGSVVFDFPATIEGLFEAELHGSGEPIAELRIEP